MLIAATMIISVAEPLKATSIDDEKKKQEELENQINDVQSTLDNLESLKNDTAAYIKAMDTKLNEITAHVNELNTQASAKQTEIDEINVTLTAKEEDINSQYEAMKKRIRFMYENGQTEYLEMMLGSDSLGDFLNKAEYISEITEYDRNMLDKMRETKKQIEETKITLENEQQSLKKLLNEAQTEQASMQKLVDAKQEQLEATQNKIDSTENNISSMQSELEAQEEIVKELEAIEKKRKAEEEKRRQEEELRRQQAALNGDNSANNGSNSSPSYDGGMFMWPVPGYTYISSEFGNRVSPISGKPEFHSGFDIPAPTGTPIYAAYSGTVAWANSRISAGNWIGIDHGGKLYTVYMHMSSFAVSSGDVVSKGDVIGYVGSTGWSTGAHLHFSVRLNGAYVNPHNYVG